MCLLDALSRCKTDEERQALKAFVRALKEDHQALDDSTCPVCGDPCDRGDLRKSLGLYRWTHFKLGRHCWRRDDRQGSENSTQDVYRKAVPEWQMKG